MYKPFQTSENLPRSSQISLTRPDSLRASLDSVGAPHLEVLSALSGITILRASLFSDPLCSIHYSGISFLAVMVIKDVRQLVTAERQLPPKCTNFRFFTTKMYEFWVFYHQNVRILVFFKEMYKYWGVNWRLWRPLPYIRGHVSHSQKGHMN